jgi:hypothetical protein
MKMTSFRAKPIGWRGESHRHYLASKGVKTKQNYFSEMPEMRKRTIDELKKEIALWKRIESGEMTPASDKDGVVSTERLEKSKSVGRKNRIRLEEELNLHLKKGA